MANTDSESPVRSPAMVVSNPDWVPLWHSDDPLSGVIAYWGPAFAGKTTNLRHLHELAVSDPHTRLDSRLPASAPANVEGMTDERLADLGFLLLFDWRPGFLPTIGDHAITLRVATVPGMVFESAAREELVAHADAVVFVADSRPERFDATLESFEELKAFLARLDRQWGTEVLVAIQLNHRDAPDALPCDDLREALATPRPTRLQEATAITGHGVSETFRAIALAMRERMRAAHARTLLGL